MSNILPHEVILLDQALAAGEEANTQAADDMANAVENGNVWHDNPEYEEVRDRMHAIDDKFGKLATKRHSAEVLDYPTGDTVQLGSLVGVEDQGDNYDLFIVGTPVLGDDLYNKAWSLLTDNEKGEELLVAGYEAPVPQSLIGKLVGQRAVWQAGGKELSVLVTRVNNNWARDNFGPVNTSK